MLLAQYICKGLQTAIQDKLPVPLPWSAIPGAEAQSLLPSHRWESWFPVLCGFLSPSLARHATVCTTTTGTHRDPKKTRDQLNRKAQELSSLQSAAYLPWPMPAEELPSGEGLSSLTAKAFLQSKATDCSSSPQFQFSSSNIHMHTHISPKMVNFIFFLVSFHIPENKIIS